METDPIESEAVRAEIADLQRRVADLALENAKLRALLDETLKERNETTIC